MFRNQYDDSAATWSPQGRLHQVEYAMEAVKQGAAAVGLASKTHVVVAGIMRAGSDLSGYQEKVFHIDGGVGIAIAGLTADARILSKYMRTECLQYTYSFGSALPCSHLIERVAKKMHWPTLLAYRRPYGVGILMAGVDKSGEAHLFEAAPTGNFYEYHAQAIGARSQSSRTYLEKHMEEFRECGEDELVRHALAALRESTGQGGEFTSKNVSLGIAAPGRDFRILTSAELEPLLDALEGGEGEGEEEEGEKMEE